jgi:hypothetical protein
MPKFDEVVIETPARADDRWQCGWCKGMGQTTIIDVAPAPLYRVGEHCVFWCPACECRLIDAGSQRHRDAYAGSPFVVLSHPWTPEQASAGGSEKESHD